MRARNQAFFDYAGISEELLLDRLKRLLSAPKRKRRDASQRPAFNR
jgi:hypothetical protein